MDIESLNAQADALREAGNLIEAAAIYEQILRARRSFMPAAVGLGITLERLGHTRQALTYLSAVANHGATDPEVFVSLGNSYFKIGGMEPAEAAFRQAIRNGLETPEVLTNLAHALAKLGRGQEAEASLLVAIELDPKFASAHDLMAFLLPQLGRFEEAKNYARKAFALAPERTAYSVRLLFGGKVTVEDLDFVQNIEELSVAGKLEGQDEIRAEYGLAKAWEDLGRFEDSLRHYIKANSLSLKEQRDLGRSFDVQGHKREVEFLIQTYAADEIRRRSAKSSQSQLPILIVGMMRSGTTLTEQILSSHPEIAGAGELDFWVKYAPSTLNATQAHIQQTADRYLKVLEKAGPGKARVCDKMPQNCMSLGPIYVALPNCRIVHCRRDPKDTCFSIYTIPYTFHPPFAYSMKNIALTYAQYQRIMKHWKSVLPPDRFMEVDYEELVANQEAVSRRLIEFTGLEWNDACLHPERNERLVNTPSRWQVRQPIYNSSVGRWKRFAPYLERMLDDWKYTNDL